MRRKFPYSLLIGIMLGTALFAQTGNVLVFSEPGFPAADSVAPTEAQLAKLFPGAKTAGVKQLREELSTPASRLLVLPYGSAFPEEAWSGIKSFLDRG